MKSALKKGYNCGHLQFWDAWNTPSLPSLTHQLRTYRTCWDQDSILGETDNGEFWLDVGAEFDFLHEIKGYFSAEAK
jgi:hypothetical protein